VRNLLISFAASAAVTLWLVHAAKGREGRSLDNNFSQPQKLHTVPVPRIGGVGIAAGLLVGACSLLLTLNLPAMQLALLLLLCGLPAFAVGLMHDYTDTIAPRGRLLATAVSAVLAFYVLGTAIRVTDIPGLDWLVSTAAGSLFLTVLAVAGISNAINIIDGLNGLAAMCVAIMLAAISYVAFEVGDPFVGTLALVVLGAVLGFFLWNFPAGLIFLGDGGAYLLGFLVAEVALLLLVRNPEVSPLFPLLVCIYPVFETLFSIYRRYWLRASPASMPDGIHLHSLVYRRLMRWAVGNRSAKALTRRNSMTSPYLWLLCSASVVPALLFWNNSGAIAFFLVLFGVSYSLLYRRIVRFKSPRWLRVSTSRPVPLSTRDNQET
jgi:UDP-N-acetylmuramyl pentapeptide phosphotransferase/UDP-N-acetylglucosamine-1-phosphate transferase